MAVVPRHGLSGRSRTAVLCAPLLTLALLTGLTGCGGGAAGEAGEQNKSPGGKGGSSAPSNEKGEASPSGSPSPSSSPSSSALPKAADGTDTGACDDADCEVELSKGDELRPKSSYGIDEFVVHSVKDHVITWTALFSGGHVSMAAEGAQESSTTCTNGSCSGRLGKDKGTIKMNELIVEFKAIGKNRAVAKVSPKK